MDAKFEAVLNSLPSKGPRSRLEPYSELITEMRKRGHSYREIAQVLAKTCDLQVGTSTVNDFVLSRKRSKSRPSVAANAARTVSKKRAGVASKKLRSDDVEQRGTPSKGQEGILRKFQELKNRKAKMPAKKPLFAYNPDEPLRLPRKKSPKEE